MNAKKIIYLFFLVFVGGFSKSQQSGNPNAGGEYLAIHWGLEEGISEGEVSSMIKDINGFLWVGTSFGLNRFDGATFKKYFADKNKKNRTITGNVIDGLIEDSLHNIWIGTNNGLSSYDEKADSFRNFYTAVPGSIIPFWATADEVFCFDYPNSQFSAYNTHSLAKKKLAGFSPSDTIGYALSDHYPIFDSQSNSIWLENGFRLWPGGGLLQISLADGKRHKYTWPCYRGIPGHSHFSEGMRYDRKRHSIWISSPDGLMEFTLGDRKFHHVDALNNLVKAKNFYQWAGIDIDKDGKVWVGTYPKGIIIYNPSDSSVTIPFPNDSVQQKKVSEENVFLYCDRSGMIWSGFFSSKGIYQLIPFSPAVTHVTFDKHDAHKGNETVIMITNGDSGKMWMGVMPYGIKTWDPVTARLESMDLEGLIRSEKKKGFYLLPVKVDTVRKEGLDKFS